MAGKQSFWLRYQYLVVAVFVVVFVFAAIALNHQPLSYWTEYGWMVPIAFVIALVANVAGISGAALFVPFFILIFPLLFGVKLETGNTVLLGLITESFGLSSSALAFIHFGLVDSYIAKHIIVRAVPFVIIGAIVTSLIPESVLYLIVSSLLLIAVLLMRHGRYIAKRREQESGNREIVFAKRADSDIEISRHDKDGNSYEYCITKSGASKRRLAYSAGGFFQGAAGFGIGELGVISMILTKIPVRIAIGTSHLIVATAAIIASLMHFILIAASSSSGAFPWNIPVMTVPAVVLGGQVAPHIAAKIKTKSLQLFVMILFVVIALALTILAFN